MSDRGISFLVSVGMIFASLAAAAYIVASGQAHYVDGLFLLLCCLLMALVFALYVMFLINRAKQELNPPPPGKKPPAPPAE
jgi:Na+/proline symporter